jgi:hypothetical protein
MKKLTIGLAAVLMLSCASVAVAEDVKAGAQLDAGAAVGGDAAGAADATTTGSVSATANYGQLISGLNSNQQVDLSAFNDSSTVNCVTVSSLQGNSDNGASLDSAMSKGAAKKTTLQGDIQANTAFWSKIQSSCTNVADLAIDDILWVESGANGMFTIYVDDRAASGGVSGSSTTSNSTSTSTSGG